MIQRLHRRLLLASPALLTADGQPRHHDGAAPLPGVWYVGLRWLTHRASGNLLGFPTDAATTADAGAAHLTEPPSPPWPQHRGDRAPTGLDRAPTPPVRRP